MVQGTNNGGGPRWATMPRATCPRCGLTRPVGIAQHERGNVCRNTEKCKQRAARRKQVDGNG